MCLLLRKEQLADLYRPLLYAAMKGSFRGQISIRALGYGVSIVSQGDRVNLIKIPNARSPLPIFPQGLYALHGDTTFMRRVFTQTVRIAEAFRLIALLNECEMSPHTL